MIPHAQHSFLRSRSLSHHNDRPDTLMLSQLCGETGTPTDQKLHPITKSTPFHVRATMRSWRRQRSSRRYNLLRGSVWGLPLGESRVFHICSGGMRPVKLMQQTRRNRCSSHSDQDGQCMEGRYCQASSKGAAARVVQYVWRESVRCRKGRGKRGCIWSRGL